MEAETDTPDTQEHDVTEEFAGSEVDPEAEVEEDIFADEAEEGETVAEMAETEPEEPAEEPVLGSVAQLSLDVGGDEPTGSVMKVRGDSRPVEGEFAKGDRVRLVAECVIGEIHFVDKLDDSGFVVQTERRHIARIESFRVAD
jgi:hypothetical protein